MSDNKKPALVTRVEPEWAEKLKAIAQLLSQPGNPHGVAALVRTAVYERYLLCNKRGCDKEATHVLPQSELCMCEEHARYYGGYYPMTT